MKNRKERCSVDYRATRHHSFIWLANIAQEGRLCPSVGARPSRQRFQLVDIICNYLYENNRPQSGHCCQSMTGGTQCTNEGDPCPTVITDCPTRFGVFISEMGCYYPTPIYIRPCAWAGKGSHEQSSAGPTQTVLIQHRLAAYRYLANISSHIIYMMVTILMIINEYVHVLWRVAFQLL